MVSALDMPGTGPPNKKPHLTAPCLALGSPTPDCSTQRLFWGFLPSLWVSPSLKLLLGVGREVGGREQMLKEQEQSA